MARSLLALCLVIVGAALGGLALSGYYDAGDVRSRPSIATATVGAGAQFMRELPRQRFVIAESQSAAPPKLKAASVARDSVVKVQRDAKPKPKDKRPQQATAPWPWNLFSN